MTNRDSGGEQTIAGPAPFFIHDILGIANCFAVSCPYLVLVNIYNSSASLVFSETLS